MNSEFDNTHQYTNDYPTIIAQIKALTHLESDCIANMANISAVLFNSLPDVNWAGFYIYKQDELVLGPFQGNPACIRIPLHRGVCGLAATTRSIQLIDDVHAFDGHIACDAASQSEIVIPIVHNDKLIGVLDIDSPITKRFSQHDAENLSKVIDIFIDTLG